MKIAKQRYKTLVYTNEYVLDNKVAELLNDGWILYGDPRIVKGESQYSGVNELLYCQTLIRTELVYE